MSGRRGDGQLFIGRLSKDVRTRDLEDVFELYGRLARCDIKYGAEMAYAFIDYEDRRDAEDAIKYENGRQVRGSSIVVEWTKGAIRRPGARQESNQGYDECYKCHRVGHWARDCPDEGYRGGGGGGGGRRGGGGGGGGGGYRGGGGGGRRRSRSPRRRQSRSRSRSRDRKRRRSSKSRSRSRDTRRRSSKSRSRSRSAVRQSGSKSPRLDRRSVSRSRSRSRASGNENGDDGAD